MQHRKKSRQERRILRPAAVDEIAVSLSFGTAFISFITLSFVGFLLLFLFQFGLGELLKEFSQLTCVTVFLVGLSIFLIILLRDFRRLRRWTYGYVEFMLTWGTLVTIPGIREKLHEKDVRHAFGLTDEPESIDEE